MVKGRSDIFLKLEIIKKVIILPLLIIAIYVGPMAICWVAFIHMQVDIVCSTHYNGKLLGLGYFKQMQAFIKYLLLSFLVCIPAYLLCLSDISSWISLPVAVVFSSLLYYGLLHRDAHMKEVIGIIHSQIQHHKQE
jgi:hypothetical protein